MNESLRTADIGGEAPVNPYSLLEAVNRSSVSAHRSWLLLIAVMIYLLVVLAGIGHVDLLASRPVRLPVLQADIALTRFFLLAPVLFVLAHLGVLAQLAVLARKALEFDTAMRMLEVTDRRTHPLRLELHNFLPVQAIAGPERGRLLSAVVYAVIWLTLIIAPAALLLCVQVAFLPYHSSDLTWVHRAALMLDILILIAVGVFLLRADTSFLRAAGATIRRHPVGLLVASTGLGLLAAFSFLVATVPGERLDRVAQALARPNANGVARGEPGSGFVVPWLGTGLGGSLLGLLERNLKVTDASLLDREATAGRPSLVLRGRDLRFARLDRSALRHADLTGADLEGASLVGADLGGALLQCADVSALAATQDRRAAGCANVRRANLARARLQGARMAGIDLTAARLDAADLTAADLRYAVLDGASFKAADLERSDMTGGVAAQGADFTGAALRGADLTAGRLTGADFTDASLQGASLRQAWLQGAVLRGADLEAADLGQARLQGADLGGARIAAADLRGAVLWLTAAPDREAAELADLGQLILAPLGPNEMAGLDQALAGLSGARRGKVREALAPLLATDTTRPWRDAADQQGWQALGTASAAGTADNYKGRLSDHLVRLACGARPADAAVPTGVARRALAAEFKGDVPAIHDRLKAADCPASKAVVREVMEALAAAADRARGN